MTSEAITRDEELCSNPVRAVEGVVIAMNSLAFSAASGKPEETESCGPPRGGPPIAWLVVLSCFLLNFNLLGINYAYGQHLRFPCHHNHDKA
jgi:hypothetical protein